MRRDCNRLLRKIQTFDFFILRASRLGYKNKRYKSDASGGKVSHLESWLPLRFNPRMSRRSPPTLDEWHDMDEDVGGFLGLKRSGI